MDCLLSRVTSAPLRELDELAGDREAGEKAFDLRYRGEMRITVALCCLFLVACPRGPLPPKRANEVLSVSRAIDGVGVSISPWSYSGWRFTIDNKRDEQLLLRWDESSFVAADGASRGRLVRGSTRRINDASAQPSSPIARRSKLIEVAFPEALLDFKPRIGELRSGPSGSVAVAPKPDTPDNECRAQLQRCVDAKQPNDLCQRNFATCTRTPADQREAPKQDRYGDAPRELRVGVGRLVLVFESSRGRETWEGWVSFDGTQPPVEAAPVVDPPREQPIEEPKPE